MRSLVRLAEELVGLVEERDVSEIEVKWWGKRVRVVKRRETPPAPSGPERPAEEIVVRSHPEEEPPEDEQGSLREIRSSMVGTFYRAPAPDTDPYIREGDLVSVGDTVCIIEMMKIMNPIESSVEGEIARIVAEDGQRVEYNQVLFLVRPPE